MVEGAPIWLTFASRAATFSSKEATFSSTRATVSFFTSSIFAMFEASIASTFSIIFSTDMIIPY